MTEFYQLTKPQPVTLRSACDHLAPSTLADMIGDLWGQDVTEDADRLLSIITDALAANIGPEETQAILIARGIDLLDWPLRMLTEVES